MVIACPIETQLARTLSDAVADVYVAKRAYDGAKATPGAAVGQFATALAHARERERDAMKIYRRHVNVHNCGSTRSR